MGNTSRHTAVNEVSAAWYVRGPIYHLPRHFSRTLVRRPVRNFLRTWADHRCVIFAACVVFVLFIGACGSSPAQGSIGVVLGRHKITGAVHVRETPIGLAGERAGLKVGDRIKMVDGILVDRLEPARIRELLRGAVGSKVIVTVVRGDDVVHVEVTRAPLGRTPRPSSSASIE